MQVAHKYVIVAQENSNWSAWSYIRHQLMSVLYNAKLKDKHDIPARNIM